MDKPNSQDTTSNVILPEPPQDIPKKPIDMDAKIGLGKNLKTIKKENVFDVTSAFENPHKEGGVFVSDRRRTGPSIAESFSSAFSEWWNGTGGEKSTPAPKPVAAAAKPLPTPPPAETKPVIAEVAEQKPIIAKKITPDGSTVPTPEKDTVEHTADHHVTLEKIRTMKSDVSRITKTTTSEKEDPTTTKNAVPPVPEKITQPKALRVGPLTVPDVRTSTIAPLVTERSEVPTEPVPAPVEKAPEIKVQEAPERVADVPHPPVMHEVSLPPQVPPFTPPVTFREPVKHDEIFAEEEAIVDNSVAELNEIPDDIPEFHSIKNNSLLEKRMNDVLEKSAATKEQARPISSFVSMIQETSTTVVSLVAMIILGVIITILASVYIHIFDTRDESAGAPVTIPSFIETEWQETIPLTDDAETFFTTFHERIKGSRVGVVQLYPVVSQEGVERLATTQEFFDILSVSLSEAALRALDTTLMIGSVTTSTNEPYIILRTGDFDTVFSAFLMWEALMPRDLAPIFGEIGSTDVGFSDTVWNNRSMRMLKNTEGEPLLLYSFVNQNTIVITRSLPAFEKILEKF
jgi:hypothetical protein